MTDEPALIPIAASAGARVYHWKHGWIPLDGVALRTPKEDRFGTHRSRMDVHVDGEHAGQVEKRVSEGTHVSAPGSRISMGKTGVGKVTYRAHVPGQHSDYPREFRTRKDAVGHVVAEHKVAKGSNPNTPGSAPRAFDAIKIEGRPDGAGTEDDPIEVGDDLDRAVELLAQGKHVRLQQPHQVATLLDKLGQEVEKAKAAGKDAPDVDLCKVSVPGTNLFCAGHQGVPRAQMPQLSGQPQPGSPAERYVKPGAYRGEADLTEPFIKALQDRGIKITDKVVPAATLRASQNQLDGPKIVSMSKAMEAGQIPDAPIFVTRDGYIIDGHHRWATKIAIDIKDGKIGNPEDDIKQPVRELDMDIGSALSFADAFATEMGIGHVGIGKADDRHTPPVNTPKRTADLKPGDRVESEFGKGTVTDHTDRSISYRLDDGGHTINTVRGTPGYDRIKPSDSPAAPEISRTTPQQDQAKADKAARTNAFDEAVARGEDPVVWDEHATKPWKDIHPDFKSGTGDNRRVLARTHKGATVSVPWRGPGEPAGPIAERQALRDRITSPSGRSAKMQRAFQAASEGDHAWLADHGFDAAPGDSIHAHNDTNFLAFGKPDGSYSVHQVTGNGQAGKQGMKVDPSVGELPGGFEKIHDPASNPAPAGGAKDPADAIDSGHSHPVSGRGLKSGGHTSHRHEGGALAHEHAVQGYGMSKGSASPSAERDALRGRVAQASSGERSAKMQRAFTAARDGDHQWLHDHGFDTALPGRPIHVHDEQNKIAIGGTSDGHTIYKVNGNGQADKGRYGGRVVRQQQLPEGFHSVHDPMSREVPGDLPAKPGPGGGSSRDANTMAAIARITPETRAKMAESKVNSDAETLKYAQTQFPEGTRVAYGSGQAANPPSNTGVVTGHTSGGLLKIRSDKTGKDLPPSGFQHPRQTTKLVGETRTGAEANRPEGATIPTDPSKVDWKHSTMAEEYAGHPSGETLHMYDAEINGNRVGIDEPHVGQGWRYHIETSDGRSLTGDDDGRFGNVQGKGMYSSPQEAQQAALDRLRKEAGRGSAPKAPAAEAADYPVSESVPEYDPNKPFTVITQHEPDRRVQRHHFGTFGDAKRWTDANNPDTDGSMVPNVDMEHVQHPNYEAGAFWPNGENRYAAIHQNKDRPVTEYEYNTHVEPMAEENWRDAHGGRDPHDNPEDFKDFQQWAQILRESYDSGEQPITWR